MSEMISLISSRSNDLKAYRKAIEENPDSIEEWDDYDRKCRRPLHTAVYWGDLELVDLLLSLGANPNSEDWTGSTPTRYASTRNNYDIMKALLKKGGDPYKKNNKGVSAMSRALSTNNDELRNIIATYSNVEEY